VKHRIFAAAAALFFAVAALAVPAAQAATIPPGHTSTGRTADTCPFPVHIGYNTFTGPPGKAQASWETGPASCPASLRVEIQSEAGLDYRSGWIKSTNIGQITAATAKDGTTLNWARLEVKVTATGAVWCVQVPGLHHWHTCTNP
jgi:hypothetical protein